jgi:hypothetical protein
MSCEFKLDREANAAIFVQSDLEEFIALRDTAKPQDVTSKDLIVLPWMKTTVKRKCLFYKTTPERF